MPTDTLLQIELDLVAVLALSPELVDVAIIPQRTAPGDTGGGEVNDVIEDALAGIATKNGKSGVAIIVMMPEASPEDENLPGPQLDLECVIRIIENRLINEGETGTGKSAPHLAAFISRYLHHWPINGTQPLRPAREHLRDLTIPDRPGMEVVFRVRMPVMPLAETATPVLTDAGGTDGAPLVITLSCSTPEADLFYNLGPEFPATAYTEPITITEATLLRVIACAAGSRPSRILEAEITF